MKTKLLIFGITGDLSRRKLLPAITQIVQAGELDDLSIIGVSRRQVDVKELLGSTMGADTLVDRTSVFSMNLAAADEYLALKDHISLQSDEQLIVYLSVPPQSATQIVDFMGEAGINTPQVKILFEKPFGVDLVSAKEFIARTARYYTEDQIYRIDHYLAKEMAQNIVAFRGGNALFSHIWNNSAIESIEIVATEQIGIEGRAQFYEQTGALRDVLQGHLLQLLALTLMDIPHDFDWNALPAHRLAALNQLEPASPQKAVRAQYDGYQEEVENIGSTTETFVSVELTSRQPRWLGVPLRLTTGKALDKKTTEVRIHLKKQRDAQSNSIVFHIQPDEGIAIDLFTRKPGYERQFERRTLSFSYAEDTRLPDAYEQVLMDAIQSRKSLFTSSEEVIRSWEIVKPLQDAWAMDNSPLTQYEPGTSDNTIE